MIASHLDELFSSCRAAALRDSASPAVSEWYARSFQYDVSDPSGSVVRQWSSPSS